MMLPGSAGSAQREVIRAVEGSADRLVELCAALVQIPSPNPPGDTRAIGAFVRNQLAALGLEVLTYAPNVDRPNLLAEVRGSAGAGPHLVLNSHLDTFPPAEGARDPYSGRIDHGRIHGCGVGDMKAGLAISVVLAAALAKAAEGLAGRVSLTYSSDEETGGGVGTAWMLDNVPSLREADFCFVLDQSGIDQIGAGEKGVLWLRIRTAGGGGHAAYRQSTSAIDRLIEVLRTITPLRELETAGTTEGPFQSPEAKALTVNVGRFEGGTSPNLIATSAFADVDVRVPLGSKAEWALAKIREAIQIAGAECQLEVLMTSDPAFTDTKSRFVELLAAKVEATVGRPVRPAIRVGASDARLFRRAGVPAVVYGPAPHNMGADGEYVEIAEVHAVAAVYAATLAEALGPGGATSGG